MMQQRLTFLKNNMWPGSIIFVLIVLAFAMQVAISSAHSLLIRSDPAKDAVLEESPAQVTAWFSQELDSKLSDLRVFDADGRQVDNGDGGVDLYDPDHASLVVTLPPGLPNGIYVVHWSVVSTEDGDASEGEFTFGVGEAPAPNLISPAQSSSAAKKIEWPVIEIAASLGVLSIIIVSVTLFIWSSKRA